MMRSIIRNGSDDLPPNEVRGRFLEEAGEIIKISPAVERGLSSGSWPPRKWRPLR